MRDTNCVFDEISSIDESIDDISGAHAMSAAHR